MKYWINVRVTVWNSFHKKIGVRCVWISCIWLLWLRTTDERKVNFLFWSLTVIWSCLFRYHDLLSSQHLCPLFSSPSISHDQTFRLTGRHHSARGGIDVKRLSHKRICNCVRVCVQSHRCRPTICSSVLTAANKSCSVKMSMFPFGSLT